MQIHSTSLKIFISNLKNHQNLTFWPKKRISYGTGQKLTPEKSPGLETRFSHSKWTKTITIYNKKSALFGGALRKWHAWFFGSPIMGPGGQFLPKNGASRCFSTEIGHRGPWWVNQKIKHAKPAKQCRTRYLLFTLSNLITMLLITSLFIKKNNWKLVLIITQRNLHQFAPALAHIHATMYHCFRRCRTAPI